MTIKELIKKIDTYNEVAELMGTEKARLRVTIDRETEDVEDYKSFAKFVREEYIDNVAKAILEYKEYSFDKRVVIDSKDTFGWTFFTSVEFYPATF